MKSLIFDVDGTLWDSTPDTAECWREVFSEQGIECSGITASRLKQEFGKLLSDIGRSLFPELPEKIMLPLVNECCRRNNDWLLQKKPPLYDGVRELFTFLFEKKLPIVIVSNCEAGYIEVLMKIHGLEPYVTGHLCPGDTGFAKAENIRLACRKWALEEPAYVGDTLGDYRASKAAGVPFVYASYGFGSVPEFDYSISSPEELITII